MTAYPKIHEAAFVIAHDSGCTGRDMGSDVAPRIAGLLAETDAVYLADIDTFLSSLDRGGFNTLLIGDADDSLGIASAGPAYLCDFLDQVHAAVTDKRWRVA